MQDLSVSLFILAGNDINFIIYLVQQIKKGVTDMKKDLMKLIKKSNVDVDTLKIFPERWEILYDEISEF